jgi:hypothetical protein
MMKKLFGCKLLLVCMGILLGLAVWMPTPAQAMGMDLVSTLVSKLGVTKDQAAGGAGAIFKSAKGNMTPGDYKTLVTKVPEAESLQEQAPKSESKTASMLGGATSLLGKKTGGLAGSADLINSFKSLGLNQEMIGKFTPVVLDYVKEKGGPMVMGLLQKAIAF